MNEGARIELLTDRNALANRWRERAEWHETMARQYRHDADLEAAVEHESCATDYRAAAEQLEGVIA